MRLFFDTKTTGISRIKDRLDQLPCMPLRCAVALVIFPRAAQANTNLDAGGAIGLVVWLLILGLAWGFLKSLFQKGKAQATSKSYHGASHPIEPPTPSPDSIRTHYDNLQVARTASETVIRSAYKGLAQKYHPDRFDGDPAHAERIMKFLNEAYAVLSDPDRRKEHDQWIDEQLGEKTRSSPAEKEAGRQQRDPTEDERQAEIDQAARNARWAEEDQRNISQAAEKERKRHELASAKTQIARRNRKAWLKKLAGIFLLITTVVVFSILPPSVWSAMHGAGRSLAAIASDYFGLYEKDAANGDANAQAILGGRYSEGDGLPKNAVKAVEWWQKAAAQGHVRAQFLLGLTYNSGDIGIPKDSAKAVQWYQKAAAQGLPEAQFFIAGSYEDGEGVTKDEAKALEWYLKAAAQGHAEAQSHLGDIYHRGQGVPQDDAKAIEWWQKAAESGEAYAQNNLGVAYQNGLGVPKDAAKAVEWYLLRVMLPHTL